MLLPSRSVKFRTTSVAGEGPSAYLDFIEEQAKEHGHMVGISFGPMARVRVSCPYVMHEVLARKSSKFAKPQLARTVLKPLLSNGLILSEGHVHSTMAKLLKPVFTTQSLESMRPRIARITLSHVLHMLRVTHRTTPQHHLDASKALSDLTLSVVCSVTMGTDMGPDLRPSLKAVKAQVTADAEKCLPAPSDSSDAKSIVYNGISVALDKLLSDSRWVIPLMIPNYVYRVPTPSNLQMRGNLRAMQGLTRRIIAQKLATRNRTASSNSAAAAPPFQAEGGDMCDRMLDALHSPEAGKEEREICTQEQMEAEVQTFVFAGHDTTSNLVSWALYCLGRHPHWHQRLRAELDALLARHCTAKAPHGREAQGTGAPAAVDNGFRELGLPCPSPALLQALAQLGSEAKSQAPVLEAVIRETLRFLPSVPRVVREPIDDVTINVPAKVLPHCTKTPDKYGKVPITLPAGLTMLLDIAAVQRHPVWGEDRHKFNPGRFLNAEGGFEQEHLPGLAWVPFAAGHRKCIGYNLALIEARIILAALVLAADFATTDDYKHFPVMAVVTRPKHGMPMRMQPRMDLPLVKAAVMQ